MTIHFHKYEGTGNDFIIIDNRNHLFDKNNHELIAKLCDRKFGIGADGLMLLGDCPGFDFRMIYFNADGKESSMCGNGGRCIVAFANTLGIIPHTAHFIAIDGTHEAMICDKDDKNTAMLLRLKMNNVMDIESTDDYTYLNTGSPHYIKIVKDAETLNVFEEGRKIRYNERFAKEGTNVNFIEKQEKGIFVRTYERGVEDETLSCGTGVVASALTASLKGIIDTKDFCKIKTKGGNLTVYFDRGGESFNNIWLEGPVKFVFKGEIVM